MVLILFISSLFATTFNHDYYGEKDFDLFYGVNLPFFRTNEYNNRVIFEDHEIKDRYLLKLFGFQDEEIKKFILEELIPGSMCPHIENDQFNSYIHYSYKLLTLSYLFESLKIRNSEAKKLDLKVCKTDWDQLIKQCNPKSDDMKRFIKNAPFIIQKSKKFIVQKDHSTKQYRIDFEKLEDSAVTHLKNRLNYQCENCSLNNTSEFESHLGKTCVIDEKLFLDICSEKDKLWGLNGIIEAYQLLSNAELLRVINQNGHARGCLQRFSEQNRKKQILPLYLQTIYADVLSHLTLNQSPYIQGELFPAGSLKEFSDKGLQDLFEQRTEPLPFIAEFKKTIVKKQSPKNKIPSPKKQTIAKKSETKTVVTEARETEIQSAFSLAGEIREEMSLDSIEVDMDKFKYDFIIPSTIAKTLETSLKEYMTRKALEEMKKYDHLGTNKGPVPLLFIKYMIDHQQHQGLYNLIAEVGDKFYVQNDLDLKPKNELELIQLVNNETTNFQWNIHILKP